MRRMFLTAVTFIFVLAAVLPVTMAQDTAVVRTIPITSLGFGAKLSPDGKTLVTFENTVLLDLDAVDPATLPMRVIDINTGEQIGKLDGFTDYAADVVFTNDGSRLVSVHQNGDVYVWDVATLNRVQSFQTPLLGLLRVKMFPDNKRILTATPGIPPHLVIVDTESGAITQTLGMHFDSFIDFQENYVQFPAQGDILISGYGLSPDGSLFATSSANDEVRLWTVADNTYQVVKEKSEKFGLFSIRQLAFTPDGKSLIYYDSSDKMTHLWDINAKSDTAVAVGAPTAALSPDGSLIAWLTLEKDQADTVSIAPLNAPDEASVLLTLRDDFVVAHGISWLTFTPDGSQLVLGGFFASEPETNQIVVLDVP